MTLYSPSFSHPGRKNSITSTLPAFRSDSAIEEEIWDRFLKAPQSYIRITLRSRSMMARCR